MNQPALCHDNPPQSTACLFCCFLEPGDPTQFSGVHFSSFNLFSLQEHNPKLIDQLCLDGYLPHVSSISQETKSQTTVLSLSRPPVMPLYQLFWGEGSPTKVDYSKKGTHILTSLLEDLGNQNHRQLSFPFSRTMCVTAAGAALVPL